MVTLKETLSRKSILISLLLILSLGSFLRFYGLSNQSLWNDELESWKESSYENITEVIEKGVYPDVHPPGYQIILFFIEKYIGDSESILRFPSAVAGALSLFMIFLVGTSLYTYKEGLIASALMAFSLCPIYYSQETRSYSLLLLFTLVSTYLWIHILKDLQNNNSNRNYFTIFGYVISAIITSYLHYFGLFLIALQGIGSVIALLHRKKALLYIIAIYISIILAYFPWWPGFWHHLNQGPIWIPPPKYTALLSYLSFCFNDSTYILLCILPFYLFFIVNSIRKLWPIKEWKDNLSLFNPTFLVLLWLITPFAIVYIKSIVSSPILTNRNLIISLPAVYLLLARSITTLPLKPMVTRIVLLGIMVLLISHNLLIKQYYSTPQKQQFREAVNYIVEHDSRTQYHSIIVGYTYYAEYFNYYFDKKHSSRTIDIVAGQQKDIPILSNVIAEKNPQYLWLIAAHRVPDREFIDFLKSKFSLVTSKTFKEASVWLFKK